MFNHETVKTEYGKEISVLGLKSLHFVLSLALFFGFWILFRYEGTTAHGDVGYRYNYFILAAYAGALYFFLRTYNAYLLGYTRIRTLILAQMISHVFAGGAVYVGVMVAWNQLRSAMPFVYLAAADLALNLSWTLLSNRLYFRLYPPRSTILVYRNERDKRRFGSIAGKPSERMYRVTKEIRWDGEDYLTLQEHLQGFEAVFVAGVDSRCRNGIAKFCQEQNIPGFFLPHVGDVIMQGAQHIHAFDSPVLYVNRKHVTPEYRVFKRLMDLTVSLIGLAALSPLMILTALAIWLYDRGPVFYRQQRLTRNGKVFTILKFRSMRVDAEGDGVARLSTGPNDDRVTPVGRWIRRLRLDELPQLINVLRGDMSLVGPRPERPEIAEQYCRVMPAFRLRLQVKAGLTGYAQVYGRYNSDPYEKLEFDLLYINSMNVLTDIQLLFATLGTLFSPESTAGIEEGAITALEDTEE